MLEYQGFLIIATILFVHGRKRLAIAALILTVLSLMLNPAVRAAYQHGYDSTVYSRG